MIEARNAYNRALEQLKNAIGLEMSREVEVEGDLRTTVNTLTARMAPILSTPAVDSLDFDPDHLVRLALQQRAEMQTLDLQIDLLEQQLEIDRGDRRPTLTLIGQYQWEWQLPNEFRARDEDVTDSWTTGLALKLPLFDGGRTRARVDQTRIAMHQVETRKNQLADQIFLETRNALLDLQEAREKIQAQRQTVALAERGLSIATARFQSGMATQLEILDAQLALTAARTQHIHALHDYAVAIVALSHATGHSIQVIERSNVRLRNC